MEKHVLVALLVGCGFEIARATALDLYATSCLVLNVLDVGTTSAHNLRSQVETWKRFQVDWDLLLGPFPL